MAVKLRLRRMGKKKQPLYKVVAADARSPRDGKFLEAIGHYNPLTDPATVDIKEDRALYWLGVGAQPTDTVRNLLSKNGILLKKELLKNGLSQEEVSAKMEEWNKLNEAKASTRKAKQSAKAEVKKTAEQVKQEVKKPAEQIKEEPETSAEEATSTASE